MSFEFQSSLVDITPEYRISGRRIGGAYLEKVGDIDSIRIIVINDADLRFALSGPYNAGDPDAIFSSLSNDLYPAAPGLLFNPSAISSIEINDKQLIVDLEGSDLKYVFKLSIVRQEPKETAMNTWEMPASSFDVLKVNMSTTNPSADNSYAALQERLEQLEEQLIGLQLSLAAVNEGLASGQLSADSMLVG